MTLKKRTIITLIVIFLAFVFFQVRSSLVYSLPIAVAIFGLVIYNSSLSEKDWLSEILYVVGLGATGSLIASLFVDATKSQLNAGLIAGYITGLVVCGVLIAVGKVGKEPSNPKR